MDYEIRLHVNEIKGFFIQINIFIYKQDYLKMHFLSLEKVTIKAYIFLYIIRFKSGMTFSRYRF